MNISSRGFNSFFSHFGLVCVLTLFRTTWSRNMEDNSRLSLAWV